MSEATLDHALGEELLSADSTLPASAPRPAASVGTSALRDAASTPGVPAPSPALRALPRGDLSPFQRWFRHWFSRTIAALLIKPWFRVTMVDGDRILREPAMYVFNHLSWMDPLVLLATFPSQPRLHFYGPKEVTLQKGIRNRFMWWTTIPVPFSPNKDDLLTSVKRAQAVFDSGGVLAIAPEGGIHVHEGDLFAFQEGAAYLAIRAGVPIVPLAITGTSWARFRGRVLVRLGEPIQPEGRPTREAVARYTALTWHALKAMIANDRDLPRPGPIGRWFTDWFNDWGEGGREAASRVHGPDPSDVPYGPGDGGRP